MMLTWKYTLPAFVFPFAFTLSAQGMGLLMQGPLEQILLATGTAMMGILALAAGLGGWIRRPANLLERALATSGGLLLFYAGTLSDVAGLALFAAAVVCHLARVRTPATQDAASTSTVSSGQ